jgi:hypothetical protein
VVPVVATTKLQTTNYKKIWLAPTLSSKFTSMYPSPTAALATHTTIIRGMLHVAPGSKVAVSTYITYAWRLIGTSEPPHGHGPPSCADHYSLEFCSIK